MQCVVLIVQVCIGLETPAVITFMDLTSSDQTTGQAHFYDHHFPLLLTVMDHNNLHLFLDHFPLPVGTNNADMTPLVIHVDAKPSVNMMAVFVTYNLPGFL